MESERNNIKKHQLQHYANINVVLLEVPPAVMGQITKGTIDHTCDELASSDEEGVDGDELAPLVRGGHFGNVDRNCHGGDA